MVSGVIDEPFGSEILALDSPDFQVEYPFIYRKELIPADWLAVLDPTWRAGTIPGRKIRLFELRDVFVAFEGLVFNKDLDVYRTSVTGHSPAEIELSVGRIRDRMQDGSLPVHLGRAVLCSKRGATNYGHFIVEMLPKAFLVRQHFPNTPLYYIVPGDRARLGDVIMDSFQMLGIDGQYLVRCSQEPAFFEEVILVDGLTQHGQYMSPVVVECLDCLASMVVPEPGERIYVSRRSAHFRKLRNEDELAPIFKEYGYRVIDPGVLPFRAQIAAFRGARSIIGVDGAGMTNICFAPPGAMVTCLTPATMPETFYWFLCTHKRHRFRDIRCAEIDAGLPGWPSWTSDIAVDATEMADWLHA
jgi:Glycosyltransferase 61